MTGAALAEIVDFYRVDASTKLDSAKRALLGQYMTPAPITRFMANLFPVDFPWANSPRSCSSAWSKVKRSIVTRSSAHRFSHSSPMPWAAAPRMRKACSDVATDSSMTAATRSAVTIASAEGRLSRGSSGSRACADGLADGERVVLEVDLEAVVFSRGRRRRLRVCRRAG